ncbi:MAG TPA: DUF190 domain-containing protein [Candidatus Manganitrophaceae bacterium]|nr:DUF190 domain-containing protein [Candidatus Manganitrophaceae bacterium]
MTRRKAKKLTIYIDETEQWRGKALYEALIEFFQRNSIAGLSLFRGFAGYGSGHVLHTTKILRLSENLPVKLEVIDAPEVIERILPDVARMVVKGLMEVAETEVIEPPR